MQNTPIIPTTLNDFLIRTDKEYCDKLITIPLFDATQTSTWSEFQKKSFAAIFYHVRGHFVNFMWYLANFSSDELTKKIILNNMHEELGAESKFSHELLYQRFAQECGVDIKHEILHETHYLSFVRQFNKGHINWLTKHDSEERISAFAAYERLDNIDYPHLTELASSLNISSAGMTFFRVHTHVEHFSAVLEKLLPTWEAFPKKIETAFHFIYSHQYQMWQNLSNAVFSLEQVRSKAS